MAENDQKNRFKQSSAIEVLVDTDFIIVAASKSFQELIGSKVKSVVGQNIFDVFPKYLQGIDQVNTMKASFKRILKNKTSEKSTVVRYEIPIAGAEDDRCEIKYWRSINSSILDQNNDVKYILQHSEDITEQVLAQKKIKAGRNRYYNLFMKSPFAVSVKKGENMIVTFANELKKEFYGEEQEVEGRSVFDILPEIKDQPYSDMLLNVYRTGIPYSAREMLVRLKNKDGKLVNRYFDIFYQPFFEEDDSISGVTTIAYDVTDMVLAKLALRENEKKLKQLLNLMPQKIAHTDSTGRIIFFNQQWTNETGLTQDELIGSGWIRTLHPDDIKNIKKDWIDTIKSGTTYEVECRIKHKDLGYRWNLSRAVPIKNDSGEILMWIGSNTDIHEQKKQKENLEIAVRDRTKELELANKELLIQNQEKERQKKELKISNKELESFAYVTSHDLQEPLRKIQIFADRIRKKEKSNLTEKGKDYFLRMENSAKRMQLLIEDLLSFSKINHIKQEFEFTDLSKIIDDIKVEFSEEIAKKNATIDVVETCKVRVIDFQFRQLMHNLISNALKYSKADVPPYIKIRGIIEKGKSLPHKKLLPDTCYCHISLSDNGIGFEDRFSKKIFEVFQKLHSKDDYPGTGIGLATVKKIVDNHQGFISATSELNKGSTFDVFIPADQDKTIDSLNSE